MERTTDKHSPRIDDAMEHDVQSLVDGRGGESRAQESRLAEDEGDSSIGVSRVTAEDRAELARCVATAHWPATRDDLVAAARADHATDPVMDLLGRLPHGRDAYENVQAVWKTLGGDVEDGHTH